MKNEVQRVLKFRIYPTDSQKAILHQCFNAAVEIYNKCLEMKKNDWDAKKKLYKESGSEDKFSKWLKDNDLSIMSVFETKREIKNWRKEFPWLEECASQLLHQAALHLDTAFKNFFRRHKAGEKPGFPKFKSKRDGKKSFAVDTAKLNWDNSTLQLPKFPDDIKVKIHRKKLTINKKDIELEKAIKEGKAKTKTITVSINPSGEYHAAVNVTLAGKEPAKKKFGEKNTVGIDLGTTTFAVLSAVKGVRKKIGNPRHFKALHKKLAKEQRRMSRKKLGSENYKKQKIKVAKIWQQISNCRNDFLHKTSHGIISDSKINAVALETLSIQDMQQSNKYLAMSISDASWFEFKKNMEYKAERQGKTIISIGRFEPTTMTCSVCDFKMEKKLNLSIRKWECPECGTTHDRDENAADVIKKVALRDYTD